MSNINQVFTYLRRICVFFSADFIHASHPVFLRGFRYSQDTVTRFLNRLNLYVDIHLSVELNGFFYSTSTFMEILFFAAIFSFEYIVDFVSYLERCPQSEIFLIPHFLPVTLVFNRFF